MALETAPPTPCCSWGCLCLQFLPTYQCGSLPRSFQSWHKNHFFNSIPRATCPAPPLHGATPCPAPHLYVPPCAAPSLPTPPPHSPPCVPHSYWLHPCSLYPSSSTPARPTPYPVPLGFPIALFLLTNYHLFFMMFTDYCLSPRPPHSSPPPPSTLHQNVNSFRGPSGFVLFAEVAAGPGKGLAHSRCSVNTVLPG